MTTTLLQAEEQTFLDNLEKKLWTSANKLLPSLDASQYKHVMLGLVFIKYVSDAFALRRGKIKVQCENPEHEYYLDPADCDGVKRYSGKTVGRPDIQAFVGALEMKRARKGVFITTSRFSKDALEYISLIEKKVVLIDGKQLADLMIKHNLGVSVKQTFQVKTIDTDYFIEE